MIGFLQGYVCMGGSLGDTMGCVLGGSMGGIMVGYLVRNMAGSRFQSNSKGAVLRLEAAHRIN